MNAITSYIKFLSSNSLKFLVFYCENEIRDRWMKCTPNLFIMQKYFSNWFRWLAARAKLTESLFKSLLFTVKNIDFVTGKVLGYIMFVTQNSAISKCVSNIVFDILWKKITIRRLHGWKISIICGEIIWKKIYLTNDFLVHRAETIVFILQYCYYFTIN